MSGRRRAYPQPQYAAAAAAAPVAGANYGVDQATLQFQAMNVASNPSFQQYPGQQQQQPGAVNGVYGQPGPNGVQGGYPQQQQGLQQGYSAQGYDYNSPYGGQQPPTLTTPQANLANQANPVGAYAATGQQGLFYGQQQQASIPLNVLYSSDLLKDLPPSISELRLDPPPLILPPTAQIVPLSEDANARPSYFRSTANVIPNNSLLLKKSKLPLALVVRPYNALKVEDEQIPVTLDTIISRCRRCRAYINPFVVLAEQGRRWRCNFCNLLNDIPSAFEYDETSGTAKNKFDRVELNHSVVEFVAPKEYMARSPQPVVYTFVIDVSIDAVASGLTGTITRTILESLDRIPNANKTARVAFIGVDSNLHYFRFNEGLDGTEMLIVSDIDEPFLPSPDGLLINLDENRMAIEKLLVDFPSYFETTANDKFALGPALRAGHKLISHIGGKLVCFLSTLPNIGEGKLQAREDPNIAPGKESLLLQAADSFYKLFAVECNSAQVTVDLFLTSSKYQDVATLLNLPRFTAGQTHFYPTWTSARVEDVTKLSKEVSDHLSMDIALEAVLRVRGSTGIRMSNFYGNFFNRLSDLCSFPTFPRDQSYVIEMSIEENLTKPVAYFQAAVLHSTSFGERRIRVMNLAIPTSSKLDDVYASADQLAITNYFTHKAIEKAVSSTLSDARELLTKSLVDILNVFRKELVAGNVAGSSPLQLSTNLRMLPLLLYSLQKHVALRSERVPSDLRAAALNTLGSLPIEHLIKYIYPSVYLLHNMDDKCGLPEETVIVDPESGEESVETLTEILLPDPMNDSRALWENYGLYLIDNSSELFLWVSGDVVPGLVYDLFGTENLYAVKTGKTELPEMTYEESEFNYRVRQVIGKLRENKDSITWKNLYVVIGGSSNEPMDITNQRELHTLRSWAMSFLVEDNIASEASYRDFLTKLKTRVAA